MDIRIPINRTRFPVILMVSISLTIILTVNLIYSKTENMAMHGFFNWIFNSIVLIVPLFYTIISLTEYIKTRFDKSAMLKISDTGLNDNLSIFSCGEISWSEISGVEILEAFKADFLVVKVFDPGKFLIDKNFVQRYILKKYIKKWGSPVVISEKRVNYNLKELKQIILNQKFK